MWGRGRCIALGLALVMIAGCGGGSSGSSFRKHSPDDVVTQFNAAGVEVGDTHTMTKDDYGLAPMACDQGIRFLIPSLGADKGGRIVSCKTQKDLDALKKYYDDLGATSAAFMSWTYSKDNILVQINGDLPEEQAAKYQAALNSLT